MVCVSVAVDLKKKLIPGMKDMIQDCQKKVHVIQAWGWYIRLLGLSALENRHLVNEMLKIPELTFSDHDPRVQIATQVAWECLVDALMLPPSHILGSNATQKHGIDQNGLSPLHIEKQAVSLSKRIKLIMTPILGVISSKCDISVRSSCFSTWCYLLHKLDHSVNHASVVKTVLEPIFEVIFQLGPENDSIWMWNSCLDILDEFISSKTKTRDNHLNSQVISSNLPTKSGFFISSICKETLKDYPIKWLPWDLCQLDFYLKMLQLLITKGLTTSSLESRKLVFDASLRIFISILKAVQVELTMTSNGFSRILLCLASILRFVRWTSEEMTSKFIMVGIHDLPSIATQFVETVRDELQPSMLASPLYKVPVDLKYIDSLHSVESLEYPAVPGISFVDYMTTVSPMAYLTTIYLSIIVQSVLHLPEAQWIPYTMQYSKFIFSSKDPLENLLATISLLHMLGQKLMQGEYFWLKIWKVVSEGLITHIGAAGNLNCLQTEPDSTGHVIMYWFLCYPFVIFYPFRRLSILAMTSDQEMNLVLSQRELELELVDTWKSLHNSANYASQLWFSERNSFSGGLFNLLIAMFGENIDIPQCSAAAILKEKEINSDFLLIFGEAAINILKQIQVSDVEVIQSRENFNSDEECNNCKEYNNVKHMLKFVARVFAAMASFVGRLFLRQDLLLLMEHTVIGPSKIITNPLIQWLSLSQEVLDRDIIHQLQLFWAQTLDCLQRVQPAIIFDSAFLSMQAPLLQTTLDHPYLPISDVTISFWISSYGKQIMASYPQCLLPVLDRLSREGKIRFHRGSSLLSSNDVECTRNSIVGMEGGPQRVMKGNKERSEIVQYCQDHVGHGDGRSYGWNQKRSRLMAARVEYQETEGDYRKTSCNVRFIQQSAEVQASDEFRNSTSNTEVQASHELRNSRSSTEVQASHELRNSKSSAELQASHELRNSKSNIELQSSNKLRNSKSIIDMLKRVDRF
ncbi:hypothetical protein ACLOJK_027731 [Asimina triloba]